ncbi:efflux RND transporter periplasmic adaptor subunit [Marinimicrobium alkaliphilum]|uniref:efflux RND transporter periplasmic adaptor subunit n=1 Tax=Marinimicrobium alkaliphilum TaxID=2202654 RepID=UPI000DBACF70|nr:efflux RND transporter periplasmic adaptor subunit [Marinimicrobium alkaliphilum]
MKKIVTWFVVLLVALVFISTALFLYGKSQEAPEVFETEAPVIGNIIEKTVATGRVVPRMEVNVTSQVSGVVERVYVEAGDTVQRGDLISHITLAPNMVTLNSAESQLQSARINLNNAERELDRQRRLYETNLISASEFNRFQLDHELRQEAVKSAENHLLLIREGSTRESDLVSNIIRAPVDGMILDVPNREGTFIVESSTYGAGTAVAVMANMNDMIFEGLIDEAEVGKIREGMNLILHVGALQEQTFDATLEHIAPKGQEDQGTIKFEIRAAVELDEEWFLRANYSANADIVLAQRDDVLTINERNLLIEGERYYVEVQTAPQQFEKREVKVGLSDGLVIEITEGLTESDLIKRQPQ